MFQRTICFGALWLVLGANAPAQTLAVLHSFSGPDGNGPTSALVSGPQGKLYGTTTSGGAFGQGTIFSITPGGLFTLQHSFSGADGAEPFGALMYASDGNLYGMTNSGGSANQGVIYQVTPGGTFSVVHNFLGFEGNNPYGALMQAKNGNGYGFTTGGGRYGFGTVFRITPQGEYTVLYNFNGTDGAYPGDTPLDLGNGVYAGTTRHGGTDSIGVAFGVDDDGDITIVNSTGPLNGSYAGLTRGPDNIFYTTTPAGGEGYGSVVAIDGRGFAMSTLDLFTPSTGNFAIAGVTFASDGALYGASSNGPQGHGKAYGCIYRTTLSGAHTVIHIFTSADGALPYGTPLQGTDSGGSEVFYGTTYSGGANNLGVVYALTVPPAS